MIFQPSSAVRTSKVDLQNLTDIHTGRYAQWVEHDVQRTSVLQERHIFLRQDAGNNTLVSVTSRHLISDGDLTFLCDIAANDHVDTRRKLIRIFSGEHLDIHDDAVFAVRNAQGGIADLSCLFTEDGAQQSFLCIQLGFTFRGNLTDQNVAGMYLCTDADDATLVQFLQSILAHVWNVAGNLFRSELGVTRFDFVFLDMNGGIYVVADHSLVEQNRVLVVVAFPGHKADQRIFHPAKSRRCWSQDHLPVPDRR
mgnify:CR=1 FL=1